MTFYLSKRSHRRLVGVQESLVEVVRHCITITPIDFTVLEGLRSLDRQRQLIAARASWTMRSRHLTGHAVDLGAIFERQVRWDWSLYIELAYAMREAARQKSVMITWGGVWDRVLNNLDGDLSGEMAQYIDRFRAKHSRMPSLDGPHYQLSWQHYPINPEEMGVPD